MRARARERTRRWSWQVAHRKAVMAAAALRSRSATTTRSKSPPGGAKPAPTRARKRSRSSPRRVDEAEPLEGARRRRSLRRAQGRPKRLPAGLKQSLRRPVATPAPRSPIAAAWAPLGACLQLARDHQQIGLVRIAQVDPAMHLARVGHAPPVPRLGLHRQPHAGQCEAVLWPVEVKEKLGRELVEAVAEQVVGRHRMQQSGRRCGRDRRSCARPRES